MADLKETTIDYVVGDKEFTYYTAERRLISKLLKQAEAHPNEVKITHTNPDGSIIVHLPIRWFKAPSPPKKVSDKQCEVMRERMKKMRETKS